MAKDSKIEIAPNLITLIAILLFDYEESGTICELILGENYNPEDKEGVYIVLSVLLANYVVQTNDALETLQTLYNNEDIDGLIAICNKQIKP